MIWMLSDTHFGHENIKHYCSRPNDWETKMVMNWNQLIKPTDWVVHLGDFAMNSHDVAFYSNLLSGKKVIVIGNHDRRADKKFPYEQCGFDKVLRNHLETFQITDEGRNYVFVHLKPMKAYEEDSEERIMDELKASPGLLESPSQKIFISHKPIENWSYTPYFYGHIHNNPIPFDDNVVFYRMPRIHGRNLCVEVINYLPVQLPALLGETMWMQNNKKNLMTDRSKDEHP